MFRFLLTVSLLAGVAGAVVLLAAPHVLSKFLKNASSTAESKDIFEWFSSNEEISSVTAERPAIGSAAALPPTMVFQPVGNLNQVFRFDINPEWVKRRWQRVSTCPAQDGLEGLRVPLVTGVQPWDLHGSLTYYFDDRHRLQRISFRGWTGNPTPLVRMVSSEFDMSSQKTLNAAFYLKKRRGKPHSFLLLENPTIIRQADASRQLVVMMEINHPSGKVALSQSGAQILTATR